MLVTGSSDDLGMGSVDIYDPAGGWSQGPKLSSDLFGAVVAPLPGGRALLAGGVPYFGATDSPNLAPLATAMLFNPASRTWTKLPDMSVIRGDATATALPDGRVLVAGGYGGRLIQLTNPPHQGFQILPLASSQFFNPTSTTWTTGPVLAHGRFAHSAVLLTGGRILVVGGADQSSPERLLDSAELLDPATGRWLSAGHQRQPPRTLYRDPMLLPPVVMHKHAILLRRHTPQKPGSAGKCACFACFIRVRSGDGAAYGVAIPIGVLPLS